MGVPEGVGVYAVAPQRIHETRFIDRLSISRRADQLAAVHSLPGLCLFLHLPEAAVLCLIDVHVCLPVLHFAGGLL